jgi:hypothetical protein
LPGNEASVGCAICAVDSSEPEASTILYVEFSEAT